MSQQTGCPAGAWTPGYPRERGLTLSLPFLRARVQACPAIIPAGRRETVVESSHPNDGHPHRAVLAVFLGMAAPLAASAAAPGEDAARLTPAEAEALVREVSAAVEQLRGLKFQDPGAGGDHRRRHRPRQFQGQDRSLGGGTGPKHPSRLRAARPSKTRASEFERLSRCALTCTLVRTKPSSNLDRRVHARAPLVRTGHEFERFDHLGSQAS